MELSNSAKIYEAYLANWKAQHVNVVEPVYVQYFALDGRRTSAEWCESKESLPGRVFTSNGSKSAKVLQDNRVVEQTVDSRGNPLFAVFKSVEDFTAFEQPKGRSEFFGEW